MFKFYSILRSLLTILTFFSILLASAQTQSFKSSDKDSYFFLNGKIVDIRNSKAFLSVPPEAQFPLTYYDRSTGISTFTSWANPWLVSYDVNGIKISEINLHGKEPLLSSTRSGVLFIKENDLWYGTLDFKKGAIVQEKRLTNLGVMYEVNLFHWYGSKILVYIQGKVHGIDLNSGEIAEFFNFNLPPGFHKNNYFYFSPDGRYVFSPFQEGGLYFCDMATLSVHSLPQIKEPGGFDVSDVSWLGNDKLIYQTPKEGIFGNQVFYVVDFNKKFAYTLFYADNIYSQIVKKWTELYEGSTSKTLSIGGSYMILPIRNRNNDSTYINLVEVQKLKPIDCKLNMEIINEWMSFQILFQWISDTKIIYRRAGGITEQGTWIYDVANNTNLKLTSFPLSNIILMQKAGVVVFCANNHLFKINTDGSDLQQLTTNQLPDTELFNFYRSSLN